jgi:hypothetical protein
MFEERKLSAPKSLYLLLVPLLEWNSEIDSFTHWTAHIVYPDSGKILYTLVISLTKPEQDIMMEVASTLQGEDMY